MPISLFDRARKQLAEGLDLALTRTALAPRAPQLGHAQRMATLALFERFYDRPEYFETPERFFAEASPIAPTQTRVRKLSADCELIDLRWPSEFEPLFSPNALAESCEALAVIEPERASLFRAAVQRLDRSGSLREKYLGVVPNRTAHARWFRHRGAPRPCAVVLHGYLGGNFALEELTWPVKKLLRAGLDVVLTLLPFHGLRRDPRRGLRPPAFPGADPRFTIEGMRQVVFDHRALFAYLAREGCPGYGVMGMSLGGFSAALLATLDPALAFVVLLVPMASVADFAHEHGGMIGSVEDQREQREALRRVQRVVSPLARAPRVTPERVLVIAGEHDRVTGRAHAEPLARHFGVETTWFKGGHVLQLGRSEAFAPLFALLERASFSRPATSSAR